MDRPESQRPGVQAWLCCKKLDLTPPGLEPELEAEEQQLEAVLDELAPQEEGLTESQMGEHWRDLGRQRP